MLHEDGDVGQRPNKIPLSALTRRQIIVLIAEVSTLVVQPSLEFVPGFGKREGCGFQ
jgi:hypothetical protein